MTPPERGGAGAETDGDRRPIEVGVRRVPWLGLDAPLPESDPGLLARIVDEIRRDGPMTFARFMDLALYDPEAGYYSAGEERGPGRAGDFLTAPEGHPIFGWTIARELEEVWHRLGEPAHFVVREHGAGSGALAEGILDGLRRSNSPLLAVVRYQAIEVKPSRIGALQRRLESADLGGYLEPVDETPAPGAILANELLDALPVHRIEGSEAGLRERFVTLDAEGALTTSLRGPSTPALAARLEAEGIHLDPGQPAEICLALDGWLLGAARSLERGLVLLIDYGVPAAQLYTPARGSTLRAYHRHRVHDDPLAAVGRQDLTAHVDLTAVERFAEAAGLEQAGRTTQAEFLAGLGIGELLVGLQSGPDATLAGYLAAKSAVVRMLDPRATGTFAVLAFARGLPLDQPLPGLGTTANRSSR
jgi:SAM-dependent MidA family methyltransferase